MKASRNSNNLLPLDDEMTEGIKPLVKPYPQMRATSETSDTPGVHPGEGGVSPTVALQGPHWQK